MQCQTVSSISNMVVVLIVLNKSGHHPTRLIPTASQARSHGADDTPWLICRAAATWHLGWTYYEWTVGCSLVQLKIMVQ